MGSKLLLVVLPPHETGKIRCALSIEQGSMLRDADRFMMDQAKADYEARCKEATRRSRPVLAPSVTEYFNKAHMLRAANVMPNILRPEVPPLV